jgi:hypothetical protein
MPPVWTDPASAPAAPPPQAIRAIIPRTRPTWPSAWKALVRRVPSPSTCKNTFGEAKGNIRNLVLRTSHETALA